MVEFSQGSKKDFAVVSTKRGRVSDVAKTLDANVVNIIGDPLAWIPRLGSVTPLEFDLFFGLGDDPTDEYIEWWLESMDIDNLPTVDSARARSLWTAVQQWRSIGTDSGPVQTMEHAEVDFFNPQTYSFEETADFTQRNAVVLACYSNLAAASQQSGVLTYAETLIQRVFGSDNWTFEDPDNSEFGQDWGDDASCDSSSS